MNYVSEIELKSLIIRIKNARIMHNTLKSTLTAVDNTEENIKRNTYINQKINLLNRLTTLNRDDTKVSLKKLRNKIKNRILDRSSKTCIDSASYEKFGEIVMMIIDRIMNKVQFRGYSYQDDFKSDASYKILRYLDNFDYTKISAITGQPVSAFAYITTIIHNSFIHIINKEKETAEFIKKQIYMQKAKMGILEDFDNDRKPVEKDKCIKNIIYIDSDCNLIDVCNEYLDKYDDELHDPEFSIEIISKNDFTLDDYAYIQTIKKSHDNVVIHSKKI